MATTKQNTPTKVNRIQQMRAALKIITPDEKETKTSDGIVAETLGAVVPKVKSFFDDVATSYKYHEVVRKERLS